MEQYISKSVVLAEIEKIRAKWFGINNDFADGQKSVLTELLTFINSLQEEPKFKTGNKVIYLNEEYEIADITDHYILHRIRTAIDGRISVLHLDFDKEELMGLVEEPVSEELEEARKAAKIAREEIYNWLANHYRDYMHNPTGEKLEAFFGGDMINDLKEAMKDE